MPWNRGDRASRGWEKYTTARSQGARADGCLRMEIPPEDQGVLLTVTLSTRKCDLRAPLRMKTDLKLPQPLVLVATSPAWALPAINAAESR